MDKGIPSLVILILLSGFLQAQEKEVAALVSQKSEREKILSEADTLLHYKDPDFSSRVKVAKSPFLPYEEEEVVEVVKETGETIVKPAVKKEPAKPVRLADAVVLRSVAKRLKPKGSLVTSRKSLLLLQGGGSLKVGDTLPVKIRGETYLVEVTAIKEKGYTLKLNDTEVRIGLNEAGSKGAIKFDNN